MRKHAVIVAIHANNSDVEIESILEVGMSFVHNDYKELEAFIRDTAPVVKRKKHSRRPGSIRTSQFV